MQTVNCHRYKTKVRQQITKQCHYIQLETDNHAHFHTLSLTHTHKPIYRKSHMQGEKLLHKGGWGKHTGDGETNMSSTGRMGDCGQRSHWRLSTERTCMKMNTRNKRVTNEYKDKCNTCTHTVFKILSDVHKNSHRVSHTHAHVCIHTVVLL